MAASLQDGWSAAIPINAGAEGDGFCFALPILRRYDFAISRRNSPEVCYQTSRPLRSEGAGKTGCLLHPRSRVRFAHNKLHTSIQGSVNTPAFPAQWLYGLLRALPENGSFASVACEKLRFSWT